MTNLDELQQTISLVALAEAAGAKFSDAHHLRSHCPLPRHAGDRSSLAFMIYDNGQKWKCHSSCPTEANGGDAIAFYMAWKGVDFKTAVKELGGISPTFEPKARVQPEVLQPAQWRQRAEARYRADNPDGKNISDLYYRAQRSRPLLMVHLLDCRSENDESRFENGIAAYGISFPGEGGSKKPEKLVEYVVNTIWWRNEYLDLLDDYEESEDE